MTPLVRLTGDSTSSFSITIFYSFHTYTGTYVDKTHRKRLNLQAETKKNSIHSIFFYYKLLQKEIHVHLFKNDKLQRRHRQNYTTESYL